MASTRVSRRYLLASPLVLVVCLLCLWLAFQWSGKHANQSNEQKVVAQTQQIPGDAGVTPSTAFSGEPGGQGRQQAPDRKIMARSRRGQPAGAGSPSAPADGSAAVQPSEVVPEPPSAQRTKAILLEMSGGKSEGLPAAQDVGGAQANVRRSRSAARSVALADLSERLPPDYFSRETRREATAPGAVASPSRWKESSVGGLSARPPGKSAPEAATGTKTPGVPDGPEKKAAAAREVLSFSEVPPEIRNSVPMSISMLSYSKQPDDRWATINGQRMREGGQMTSGLKVEEITPDGVVFNYQGHSFYKAVREN
ncbi:MAG: general secretion pathway protein GspB [Syntrophobacter sp.]